MVINNKEIETLANVVSVAWLHKNLEAKNLLVFNATIAKVTNKNAYASAEKIIPKSQFLDIKKQFSNTDSAFPNTIPTTKIFEKEAQNLGINKESVIVVYDDYGMYSSPRAWWLLKTFGFKNVAVLNGGLPEWLAKNYKTETQNTNASKSLQNKPKQGDFKAEYNPENVVFFEDIKDISENKQFKIIDARSSDRFNCLVAEPRAGLRSGTIPNSVSLPFNQVLNDTTLKSKDELDVIFKNLASKNQHLVLSCGSGITASVLALAATIAGYKNSVYDGSWTEYGSLTTL